MSGSILVCAATGWEAGPLASRLALRRVRGVPSSGGPELFDGTVRGRPVLLLRTGMGADRTGRSLEQFGLKDPVPPISCAVSAGLACGLDLALEAGRLVVDLGPGGSAWEAAARESAGRLGLRLSVGRVAQAGSVLDPAAKAALRASTGACAADMESRSLRTWAEGRGLAVVNARVILDASGEELPAGFSDPDDPWAVAGSVLRRPHLLPSLLRVGWKVRSALAGLADFLEEFLPRL